MNTKIGPERALHDVMAERQRQVNVEGWTPEHDDQHGDGVMAIAAACYALVDQKSMQVGKNPSVDLLRLWGWTGWSWTAWWKPKDRRRNLVRAAALLLAEIERLDRAEAQPDQNPHEQARQWCEANCGLAEHRTDCPRAAYARGVAGACDAAPGCPCFDRHGTQVSPCYRNAGVPARGPTDEQKRVAGTHAFGCRCDACRATYYLPTSKESP